MEWLMLKNSIGDKTEFVTEIYVDGEEDAVVVVSSTREIDAVDDAMYEFKKLDIPNNLLIFGSGIEQEIIAIVDRSTIPVTILEYREQ